MENPIAPDTSQPDFPTARVEPAMTTSRFAQNMASRLWIVTALCLLVAIGLVWAEVRSRGERIEIVFAEGHGLVPGDSVRYRGIQVGIIESIQLADDLTEVKVIARLNTGNGSLAREGTRFWVERPDIRIGQVRGLDTLMGGRYVGVLPGPLSAAPANTFEGLPDAPASTEEVSEGLELVLEAQQRFGLQRGSPVSYRGVEVGHVISVGLANDSANVVARTFIKPQYRSLVRENTHFWSSSGIGLKVGLTGLELDADTLATIAAGGVALATPNTPGNVVATGHRFELFKSPREEWLVWQPRIAIGSASLPEGITMPKPVLGVRRGKGAFSLLGRSQRRGWLLPLNTGKVLVPADLVAENASNEPFLEAWGEQLPLDEGNITILDALALLSVPESLQEFEDAWPTSQMRTLGEPEEVIITCGSDDLTIPLLPERIKATESGWKIDTRVPIGDSWHGASVVAARDGFLVGVLVYSDQGGTIVPLPKEL